MPNHKIQTKQSTEMERKVKKPVSYDEKFRKEQRFMATLVKELLFESDLEDILDIAHTGDDLNIEYCGIELLRSSYPFGFMFLIIVSFFVVNLSKCIVSYYRPNIMCFNN